MQCPCYRVPCTESVTGDLSDSKPASAWYFSFFFLLSISTCCVTLNSLESSKLPKDAGFVCDKAVVLQDKINLLATDFFLQILAHPVFKM